MGLREQVLAKGNCVGICPNQEAFDAWTEDVVALPCPCKGCPGDVMNSEIDEPRYLPKEVITCFS